MCLRFLLICLISVSAGRIDLKYFRDHYVGQSADGSIGFEDLGERAKSFGENFDQSATGKIGEDHEFEHRGFETGFGQREFHQSSDGENIDRIFRNRDSGSIFSDSDLHKYNHRDIDSESKASQERSIGDRVNQESESKRTNNDREIHDRSIESTRRKNVNHKIHFDTSEQGFQSSFGTGFNSHNFQGNSDSVNRRVSNSNSNRSFGSHTDSFNGFSQENTNHDSNLHDTTFQNHKHSNSESQVNKKDEFELISSENLKNNNNENYKEYNTRNNDDRLPSKYGDEQNRETHVSRTKTNIHNNKNVNVENAQIERSQSRNVEPLRHSTDYKSNTHNVANDRKVDVDRVQDSRTHNTHSGPQRTNIDQSHNKNHRHQRPEVKTSTDNEILYNANQNPVNNEERGKEDKQIWGDEEEKKNDTSTVVPDKVTIDDRAAFVGGKCPSGKIKINDTCIDIH